MKQKFLILLLLFTLIPTLIVFSSTECILAAEQQKKTKNVIFMIMDGANSTAITLARMYKGHPLIMDEMLSGGVRTYALDSAITDSAAAATAMATGKKTTTGSIAMIPKKGKPKSFLPAQTLVEAAEEQGIATGIIATSPIQHATPAAFSSHASDRNDFNNIAEQQLYQNMEVVLGGGRSWLFPDPNKGTRPDKENLLTEIKTKGYEYVQTKDELQKASGPKLWGSFAWEDLSYEWDRKQLSPKQPSLQDMTAKAIELLSSHPKGFFLLVEGSKVDWAAHKNDPIGMISELLSFDKAVGEALDFAKRDKNTLVIAVADHGNGGLSIGNHTTDHTYRQQPSKHIFPLLKKANMTASGAVSQLKKDRSNLKEVMANYGLEHVGTKEYCQIKKAKHPEKAMASLLSEKARLGFTTEGHTGEDVFLYTYGPGRPYGLINNTDLALFAARALGITLRQDFYADGEALLKSQGYQTERTGTPAENLELRATKDHKFLRYPVNKNFRYVNGQKESLRGVTVMYKETFFIPKSSTVDK
ncbi:MAG TPA: alkaline phosphatase [Chondromyces sp.]|nr:alkaline phosphatase [Chondromyces sp.]